MCDDVTSKIRAHYIRIQSKPNDHHECRCEKIRGLNRLRGRLALRQRANFLTRKILNAVANCINS